MAVDWPKLRAIGGSRHTAFEEVCCQLALHERTLDADLATATYHRVGAPDGGLECYWRFDDGAEWGWQAKLFEGQGAPSADQLRQVDHSVARALETHPRLNRYYVCMPVDLQNPGNPEKTSAKDRWDKRQTKWMAMANAKGMTVEFIWWGATELNHRIESNDLRGLAWFFFGTELLTPEWCMKHVGEWRASQAFGGPPTVDVQLMARLRRFARGPTYYHEVAASLRDVLTVRSRLRQPGADQTSPLDPEIMGLLSGCDSVHGEIGDALADTEDGLSLLGQATDSARQVAATGWSVADQIDALRSTTEPSAAERAKRNLAHDIRAVARALADSAEVMAQREPYATTMAVTGPAGAGKSRALFDIARELADDGWPVLCVSARGYNGTEFWGWLRDAVGLPPTLSRDELLGALETAARLAGARAVREADTAAPAALVGAAVRAVIMVDALNESLPEGLSAWEANLPQITEVLSHHPRLGLVVSLRSEYDSSLALFRQQDGSRVVEYEHRGFGASAREGLRVFCEHYQLVQPAAPIPRPEYENPLFLTLLCESLHDQGLSAFPRDLDGLGGILGLFRCHIDHLNRRLSHRDRLDYRPDRRVVQDAVQVVTEAMVAAQSPYLPQDEVEPLLEGILPTRGRYSDSLLWALLDEGCLRLSPDYGQRHEGSQLVSFALNRLGDHLVARQILECHVDKVNPLAAFQADGPMAWLTDPEHWWRHRDWLAALMVQVPEEFGVELLPLLVDRLRADVAEKDQARDRHSSAIEDWATSFVTGLAWRKTSSYGEGTCRCIEEWVLDYAWRELLHASLAVSCIDGHPLNAQWLHDLLASKPMPKRDRFWAHFVDWSCDADDDSAGVVEYIRWVQEASCLDQLTEETARLLALPLAWFLESPNRYVRDRATKALVRLCAGRLPLASTILAQFDGVDAPYAVQRLYAVAYGAALLSTDSVAIGRLAGDVFERIFAHGEAPPDLLLRDHAACLVEYAHALGELKGIDLRLARPPYGSDLPAAPEAEPSCELGAESPTDRQPTRAESGLKASLSSSGDFARYVVGSDHPQAFPWAGARLSAPEGRMEVLRAWLLQRVFGLGWSDELHGRYDCDAMDNRNLLWSRPGSPPRERIGKKYQWLAWHELAAKMADNCEFQEQFEGTRAYQGAWQISGMRDIDPSCLMPAAEDDSVRNGLSSGGPWFSSAPQPDLGPAQASFEWLTDDGGLPDIRQLLALRDPGRPLDQWLVLHANYTWQPPLKWDARTDAYPSRMVWYHLHGYLVHRSDLVGIQEWARGTRWYNDVMPSVTLRRAYLGEMCRAATAWREPWQDGADGWTREGRDELPFPVVVPCVSYEWSADQDRSGTAKDLLLPSPWLQRAWDLTWQPPGMVWSDRSGQPVLQNPTPESWDALLVRPDALRQFLAERDLALVWTVLGEKQILDGGMGNETGWYESCGLAWLGDGGVEVELANHYEPPHARQQGADRVESAVRGRD